MFEDVNNFVSLIVRHKKELKKGHKKADKKRRIKKAFKKGRKKSDKKET